MSGARWLRAIAAMSLLLLTSTIGWLLIAPIAALVPKRRDWIAVIGRDDGQFVDNAKYFYLQSAPLLAPKVRTVFVTERHAIVDLLNAVAFKAMVYPSPRSIGFLLRAGTVVVDSIEWTQRWRRFLTIGAKRMQLWHGVGFKRIERDKWRNETDRGKALSSFALVSLRQALHRFTGRMVRYDVVNTTSRFYRDNVFASAFLSRHFLVTGYPRNVFGELAEPARSLAWRNVDAGIAQQLTQWAQARCRLVLVTPTFRDSRSTPMGLTPEAIAHLDDYCELHGVEMIFKFHPYERMAEQVRGRHLHLCGADTDIYPLLPLASAMVSDYSSIYMDFLLLDKPVLFLVPDLDEYVRSDRQIQFDFHQMTPGPKVSTWLELTAQLDHQWKTDEFAQARADLRLKAFDDLPQDQAVPKLIDFMHRQGWLAQSIP